MQDTQTFIPVTRLRDGAAREISLRLDDAALTRMTADLGIDGLRKVALTGTLEPQGKGWVLTGHLGATAIQPCVVTLAPVTTRIDKPVRRDYLRHLREPPGTEVEMDPDTDTESLGDGIDLLALMAEEISLSLPDFPRAEGADLGEARFAAPGVTPLSEADLKPFAGLKALRDKLDEGEK